ncbi:MAG: biotin/lipoyl-binding protein [Campylobacterales bacterium]|nr:biotin/lipoyl-binding protein [Campylobacterales bacterium]
MSQNVMGELVSTPKNPTPQTNDTGYHKLGWIVLGGFVGIFGIWASLAPLESAIPASGKVIVASNNQVIQNLEGGIVHAILVSDGAHVKKGDAVIILDATQASSQLKTIEAQYYEYLALESRLLAERDHKGSIYFSHELSPMDPQMRSIITDNQRREFTARANALRDEAAILTQRIEQLYSQIEGLQATIESKTSLANSYRDEVKEWEVL